MPGQASHSDFEIQMRPHVVWVEEMLGRGVAASEVTNQLVAKGLGRIQLVYVFRQATGARLMDLKQFADMVCLRRGVTDVEAFDALAEAVLG